MGRRGGGRHPSIGADVSSYYVAAARTAIDPLLPERGLEALGPVEHVVCTIGLHGRSTQEFGVPVRVPTDDPRRD